MAKQRNGWKLSSDSILNDMQEACVEHDYGGRCNSMDNDTRNIVSIDMRACNPASFPECEAKPYFERFGHRTNNIAHVSIKDPPPLSQEIDTDFSQVQEWEFACNCHPVSLPGSGSISLALLVESSLLKSLKTRKAMIAFENQTVVCFRVVPTTTFIPL